MDPQGLQRVDRGWNDPANPIPIPHDHMCVLTCMDEYNRKEKNPSVMSSPGQVHLGELIDQGNPVELFNTP